MIKCNACGFENEDDAKFCENCGVQIGKIKCQKCGNLVSPTAKFCNKCGNPLKEEKPIVSLKKNEKLNRILTIVLESFSILFIVMMFVAIWGDFAKVTISSASGSSVTNTYGVSYWFSDGWKIFNESGPALIGGKINFILGFLAFIVSLAFIFIFGIKGLIKTIINLAKKSPEAIPFKDVILTAVFASLYFVFTKMIYSYSITSSAGGTSATMSLGFGWGSIIYIVMISILFVAFLARRIILNLTGGNKNTYLIIKDCSSFIFILLFALIGFGVFSGFKQSVTTIVTEASQTSYYSPFCFMSNIISQFFTQSIDSFPLASFLMILFAMVFAIIAIIFTLFLIYSVLSDKDKIIDRNKVFLPITCAVYAFAMIFELISIKLYIIFIQKLQPTYQNQTLPGINAILGLIFIIVAIVLFFVFKNLAKKKDNKNQNTIKQPE